MVIFRALKSATFGTALGLTLASCAMSGGSASPDMANSSSSSMVAGVNRAAAASISAPQNTPATSFSTLRFGKGPHTGTQMASLDPMIGAADPRIVADYGADAPVVRKGTVLWHRTGEESDLPPTPLVSEELRRLRESLRQVQGQTSQQLTELQSRMDSNQKTIAQVAEDQTRQERDLRAQAADAVGSVAQLASESMRSMERVARNTSDRWFATNQQLVQLEGKLQSAIADTQARQAKADDRTQAYTDLKVSKAQLETQLASVREARQAAMEAELRAKSFTGQQLASRDQILGGLLNNAETEKQVHAAKLQALQETTDTKLAAVQAIQGTQFNALSNQLAGNQQLTVAQLNALKNDMTQQVSSSQQLTAAQLQALKAETAARLEGTEKAQTATFGAKLDAVGEQIKSTQQLTAAQLDSLKAETAARLDGAEKAQLARIESVGNQLQSTHQLTSAQLDALKAETTARLQTADNLQSYRLASVGSEVRANQQITAAQLDALKSETSTQLQSVRNETATRLASAQAVQGAQLAAVSNQIATNQQLTAMQIAELRKLNEESRALASSETANVAAALREYGDTQLQQVVASTNSTLASLAEATDQSVADLRTQTNRRLGVMWQAAGQRAEKLAEEKANAVAASLAALQSQTAAQKIEPAQIRAIAEQTVADSTPEFRALALRTMQESQDYIRATARAAVQDKDPGMQTALADAARDVITKDDRVVFAIRKAVAEELQGVALDASGTTVGATSLGPDHGRALLGGEEGLDPNRLRIAQLLSPGGGPAPDAARLAAISPAAGNAPQAQGLGGQQSWSVPGTSLMRSRNRADWMDIRQYKVVVHEDDQTLESLLDKVLKNAEPFTGPWQVRWKVSSENRDVMLEKFSLDAETTFEEFVSYLAQYVVNDRGVKLSFSLFDNERIIVISD